MSTVYKNVGNYSHYCEEILKEYSFPDNKRGKDLNYEWPKTRYRDLPTTIMKICHDACESAEDIYLLKSNPFIIVERHHKILSKDGKVKNNFAVHSDRDGPAGGPCRSILFYYQIDEDIDDDDNLNQMSWRGFSPGAKAAAGFELIVDEATGYTFS